VLHRADVGELAGNFRRIGEIDGEAAGPASDFPGRGLPRAASRR
jgi:hypothetical protein